MEKEFATYEQASALKELGFDESCFATYDEDKEFEIQDFEQTYDTFPSHIIAAPLKQQAFRWFREKYGYYYQIGNSGDNTKFLMLRDSEMSIVWNDKGFNTYEEAELECLKKLIEIVKEKQ